RRVTQRCMACGERYPLERVTYACAACDGALEIECDAAALAPGCDAALATGAPFAGRGVWRYAPLLPVGRAGAVSLGEGDTRLHAGERLAARVGVGKVLIKTEGDNPTGSFKDRGMTVGVTQALRLGMRAVACASTGNTSASMAAYAARAGLRAIVLI